MCHRIGTHIFPICSLSSIKNIYFYFRIRKFTDMRRQGTRRNTINHTLQPSIMCFLFLRWIFYDIIHKYSHRKCLLILNTELIILIIPHLKFPFNVIYLLKEYILILPTRQIPGLYSTLSAWYISKLPTRQIPLHNFCINSWSFSKLPTRQIPCRCAGLGFCLFSKLPTRQIPW